MDGPGTPLIQPRNAALHRSIKELYDNAVREFKDADNDFNSQTFLEKFPNFSYIGMFRHSEEDNRAAEEIVRAAFASEFETRTDESLKVYFSNSVGSTREDNFCEMVDDFLNYVIPRTAGLPEADRIFDEQFDAFEQSLYLDSFSFTVCSLLKNTSDHSGSARDTSGVKLTYYSPLPGKAVVNVAPLRHRVVSYYEITHAAHLRENGNPPGLPFLLVMEFTEKVKKDEKAVKRIYERVQEITNKVVFALRLVTHAAVYSHYRGRRIPGGMAGHRFFMMDYPNEVIEYSPQSGSLDTSGELLRRLMPEVLACPYDRMAVVDHKIEDALRRMGRANIHRDRETQLAAEIDLLLDYMQALESMVPASGSYNISLHASVLLKACKPRASINASEIFDFLRTMYAIRNDVMHGKLKKVLDGVANAKFALNTHQLRMYVYDLAMLHVMNEDLGSLAHKLALGESVQLRTIYY
jgi:hypothetical protein